MLKLPQRCARHGINGGFVDFYGIAVFGLGGNKKAILFLAARHIPAKTALTATLKSRTRYTVCILAHKHAVAVLPRVVWYRMPLLTQYPLGAFILILRCMLYFARCKGNPYKV